MLTIDPEFRSLIPPLSAEELKQLEENVVAAGGASDALVTWNGILLDGHNRYEICQRNGLPFATREVEIEDRDAAKIWIMRHQLGRRNLVAYVRAELVIRLKDAIKEKAKERLLAGAKNHRGNQYTEKMEPLTNESKAPLDGPIHTRKELARIAGVGESTIQRTQFIADKVPEEVKQQIRTGEKTLNEVYTEVAPRKEASKTIRPPEPKEEATSNKQSAENASGAKEEHSNQPERRDRRKGMMAMRRANATVAEAWTMIDRPSMQVNIYELRLRIKQLREDLEIAERHLEERA